MKFNNKNIILFVFTYILLIVVVNLVIAIFLTPNFNVAISILLNWPTSLSFTSPSCLFFPLNPFDKSLSLYCPVNWGLILFNVFFTALSYLLVFSKKLKYTYWIIIFIFLNIFIALIFVLKNYLQMP